MTLNEYQDKAMSTCMESCDNFGYMMLNLVGEVGELASKVAKDIRKERQALSSRIYPTSDPLTGRLTDHVKRKKLATFYGCSQDSPRCTDIRLKR